MAARTNGHVQFGSFMTFLGGMFAAQGISEFSNSIWQGVTLAVLGFVLDGLGIARIGIGIKEIVRVHDLEKKNSRV